MATTPETTLTAPAPFAKSSRQVPIVLPAAVIVNGQVATPGEAFAAASGNQFYVLASSAPVSIQPVSAQATGIANVFQTGQGQKTGQTFDTLTVKNFSAFPVTCLIWIGFEDFINDQLIIANNILVQFAYPTYPVANAAASVAINDLSGQRILDINGKPYGTINRVAILVFNADTGVTLLLQKAGSSVANGPAVGIIYPVTPVRFDFSGNYSLSVGGGNINAIVSEIYQGFATV